jgi:dTDP-4-dehydrorhamnose 3,5-epimerase
MSFEFTETVIPGVILVTPEIFGDQRGFFSEIYKTSEFQAAGIGDTFVQVNHSKSSRDVLRGLHYQINPKAQAKLIRVLSGEIFDVAVDLRKGSSTYGKWVGETLSEKNRKMLYIPGGLAHGFSVMSESAEIVYYCDTEYAPECERGIMWNDPDLGIEWPVEEPVLSEKDSILPQLKDADNNFV